MKAEQKGVKVGDPDINWYTNVRTSSRLHGDIVTRSAHTGIDRRKPAEQVANGQLRQPRAHEPSNRAMADPKVSEGWCRQVQRDLVDFNTRTATFLHKCDGTSSTWADLRQIAHQCDLASRRLATSLEQADRVGEEPDDDLLIQACGLAEFIPGPRSATAEATRAHSELASLKERAGAAVRTIEAGGARRVLEEHQDTLASKAAARADEVTIAQLYVNARRYFVSNDSGVVGRLLTHNGRGPAGGVSPVLLTFLEGVVAGIPNAVKRTGLADLVAGGRKRRRNKATRDNDSDDDTFGNPNEDEYMDQPYDINPARAYPRPNEDVMRDTPEEAISPWVVTGVFDGQIGLHANFAPLFEQLAKIQFVTEPELVLLHIDPTVRGAIHAAEQTLRTAVPDLREDWYWITGKRAPVPQPLSQAGSIERVLKQRLDKAKVRHLFGEDVADSVAAHSSPHDGAADSDALLKGLREKGLGVQVLSPAFKFMERVPLALRSTPGAAEALLQIMAERTGTEEDLRIEDVLIMGDFGAAEFIERLVRTFQEQAHGMMQSYLGDMLRVGLGPDDARDRQTHALMTVPVVRMPSDGELQFLPQSYNTWKNPDFALTSLALQMENEDALALVPHMSDRPDPQRSAVPEGSRQPERRVSNAGSQFAARPQMIGAMYSRMRMFGDASAQVASSELTAHGQNGRAGVNEQETLASTDTANSVQASPLHGLLKENDLYCQSHKGKLNLCDLPVGGLVLRPLPYKHKTSGVAVGRSSVDHPDFASFLVSAKYKGARASILGKGFQASGPACLETDYHINNYIPAEERSTTEFYTDTIVTDDRVFVAVSEELAGAGCDNNTVTHEAHFKPAAGPWSTRSGETITIRTSTSTSTSTAPIMEFSVRQSVGRANVFMPFTESVLALKPQFEGLHFLPEITPDDSVNKDLAVQQRRELMRRISLLTDDLEDKRNDEKQKEILRVKEMLSSLTLDLLPRFAAVIRATLRAMFPNLTNASEMDLVQSFIVQDHIVPPSKIGRVVKKKILSAIETHLFNPMFFESPVAQERGSPTVYVGGMEAIFTNVVFPILARVRETARYALLGQLQRMTVPPLPKLARLYTDENVRAYFSKLVAIKMLRANNLYPELSRMYTVRDMNQNMKFEEYATIETIRKLAAGRQSV